MLRSTLGHCVQQNLQEGIARNIAVRYDHTYFVLIECVMNNIECPQTLLLQSIKRNESG